MNSNQYQHPNHTSASALPKSKRPVRNYDISNDMKILKNKSLVLSRNKVADKFKTVTDLQDITTIRSQIEKQLLVTDSQLNLIIQSKLDALKKSIDLIDESSDKLSQFSKTMTVISEKVNNTNTEISKYPCLKRVHNIRDNLQKVINQIEYFGNVPEKCKILQKALKSNKISNTIKLKEIFLESVKLESLRNGLISELKDTEITLKISVNRYLNPVNELVNNIINNILLFMKGGNDSSSSDTTDEEDQQLLLNNNKNTATASSLKKDFIDRAVSSPADLVGYLELIELHQEYYERRVLQALVMLQQQQQQLLSINNNSSSSSNNNNNKGVSPGTGGGGKGSSNNNNKNNDNDNEEDDDDDDEYTGRQSRSLSLLPSQAAASSSTSSWVVYNLRPKIIDILKQSLERRIAQCYADYLNVAITNAKNNHINMNNNFNNDDDDDDDDDDGDNKSKNNNNDINVIIKKVSFQVTPILDASSELVRLLVDIINDVDPCFPRCYNLVLFYFSLFESQLLPKIDYLCSASNENVKSLDVVHILDIIDWCRYFNSQMDRFGLSDQPCCLKFNKLCDEVLLNEYLARMKNQVMVWFRNIERQEIELIQSADGRYMTTVPEDMYNVVYIQLGVAKDGLPADRLKDAINSCFNVLSEVQAKNTERLSLRWNNPDEYDPARLCAFINDHRRMQEKCIELAGNIISAVPGSQVTERESLAEKAQSVATQYFVIANQAVVYLARLIVSDLEPVFLKLFTPEWESSGGSGSSVSSSNSSSGGYTALGKVITATCEDYFQDMTRWLSPIFYGKFIHHILHFITSHYCNAIRHRFHSTPRDDNNNIQRFMNEYKISELILTDKAVLTAFFDLYDNDVRTGLGLPLKLDDTKDKDSNNNKSSTSTAAIASPPHMIDLVSLQYLSQIFMVSADGSELNSVGNEIKYIFDRYHVDGLRILQCIVQCQSSVNKQERKAMDEFIVASFMKCALLSFSSPTTNTTTTTDTSNCNNTTTTTATVYKLSLGEEYAYIGDSSIDLVGMVGSVNASQLQQAFMTYKKTSAMLLPQQALLRKDQNGCSNSSSSNTGSSNNTNNVMSSNKSKMSNNNGDDDVDTNVNTVGVKKSFWSK